MSSWRSFDLIARPYRALEYLTLGRSLERTRLHLLPRLLHSRNALVLGDGDGRFLSHLLVANPYLNATAVDISAEMLRLLRERCSPNAERLRTHQADALSFIPPAEAHYDLVVTHFFLDCLTQSALNYLIAGIAPSLTPNALWVVSDFRIPSGFMRRPSQILIRSLYLAFRILTKLPARQLPDHAKTLYAAGFTCIARQFFLAGVLTTELWQRRKPSSEAGS